LILHFFESAKVSEPNDRQAAGKLEEPEPNKSSKKIWLSAGVVVAVTGAAWLLHSAVASGASTDTQAPPPPQVVVAKPVIKQLDRQIRLLGQFSAVDQVELRAQVGGTLTGIHFRDGEVVHKGDLLFTIDSRPYEIKLDQATAQLETAKARLNLANSELHRSQELQRNDAGTVQDVEQRTSEQQSAQAAVDNAKAQIRDAQFDLEHCRIVAPFTGRIGNHQVSIGNLVAGSRAATSPTTLLATLVSLDPIHLDFDMSESDYQSFSKYRAQANGNTVNRVELALADEKTFDRHGALDFVDNRLDRSSGTIHARATVANPNLDLTPGEFARVRLVVAQPAPTLLVPDTAVLPDQSEHVIMSLTSANTVVAKQVEVGEIRDGLRVIRSGLGPTDPVIVDGLTFASPGAKVTPHQSEIHASASAPEQN
jgi:multidrug efflux system membrane fusion protein